MLSSYYILYNYICFTVETVFKHEAFDVKKKFNQSISERYDTSIERVVTLLDMSLNNGWMMDELRLIGP